MSYITVGDLRDAMKGLDRDDPVIIHLDNLSGHIDEIQVNDVDGKGWGLKLFIIDPRKDLPPPIRDTSRAVRTPRRAAVRRQVTGGVVNTSPEINNLLHELEPVQRSVDNFYISHIHTTGNHYTSLSELRAEVAQVGQRERNEG